MADTVSLWSPIDQSVQEAARPAARRFAWVLGALPALVGLFALALATLIPPTLAMPARLALFAFGGATILWTLTGLNATYVALGAVLLLCVSGAIPQEKLFQMLGHDIIWLMIGAFVLGQAVETSGLSARLTRRVIERSRSVGDLLWLVTLTLLPLAFFIPSTSGRAAVALPIFRSLAAAACDASVTRALALLFPSVILVSTIASLVGAGSHLIANDLLRGVAGRAIGFGEWALYGVPFGVAASLVTAFVIGRMFLHPVTRAAVIRAVPIARAEWSPQERRTAMVAALMLALWLTTGWHHLDIATVSVGGGFLLMLPGPGVVSWKAGLKAVSWNLIIFVGAALVLGQALIDTGAAGWLVAQMFSATGLGSTTSTAVALVAISVLTLTSHIYLTSHAARAAALIPPLMLLSTTLSLNPVAVMFIATAGMNYCLTFPVSSKALLMFQELDVPTWTPADLLRLSAVLLPLHAALMALFYYGYWQHVGLSLAVPT